MSALSLEQHFEFSFDGLFRALTLKNYKKKN